MLSRQSICQVIAFDHRKSVLSKIPSAGDCREDVQIYVDVEKSSSTTVYEYFSKKILDMQSSCLLELSSVDLVAKGHTYISSRQSAASKLLDKAFKVRLGRGFYGECVGVRADGVSDLSHEIGKQLSLKSAGPGLRPIGAVVYMKRKGLKMCLRSTDLATDTCEVAKAYGGGGSPNLSSFMIRMDEYNHWISAN